MLFLLRVQTSALQLQLFVFISLFFQKSNFRRSSYWISTPENKEMSAYYHAFVGNYNESQQRTEQHHKMPLEIPFKLSVTFFHKQKYRMASTSMLSGNHYKCQVQSKAAFIQFMKKKKISSECLSGVRHMIVPVILVCYHQSQVRDRFSKAELIREKNTEYNCRPNCSSGSGGQ